MAANLEDRHSAETMLNYDDAPSPEPPIKVLIVDDEDQILISMADLLNGPPSQDFSELRRVANALFGSRPVEQTRPAFDTTCCSQGEDAIVLVEQAASVGEVFDVAVVDINMPPGLSGLVTADRLRKIDPGLYVIIISGMRGADPSWIPAAGLTSGRIGYLEKPLRANELRHLLTTYGRARLEERRQERTTDIVAENFMAPPGLGDWPLRVRMNGAIRCDDAETRRYLKTLLFLEPSECGNFQLSDDVQCLTLIKELQTLAEENEDMPESAIAIRDDKGSVSHLLILGDGNRTRSVTTTGEEQKLRIVELARGWPLDMLDRGLTTTELAVGGGLGYGVPAKSLARALGMAYNTLKVHRRNIYQKLGIRRQTELTMLLNKTMQA